MADILGIGSLASMSYKKAIEVTSHNVANVGTDGYHRQRAEIVSNAPQVAGNGFLGGGSRVDSVTRVYEDYIQNQLISANTLNERYDQQLKLSKQIEGVVASNDQGVQQFMQRFFDSMQNLANDPTSNTNRRLVLNESTNLESHIGNLSSILDDNKQETNNQIKDTVEKINQNLQTIQKINTQVARALASSQQPPNDLLDKREKAIKDLSTNLDIKPFRHKDGTIDIHTANGRIPLISDNTLTPLSAHFSDFTNEGRIEVFANIGGQEKKISDQIVGGQLGGILDFRKTMSDKAQNELGVSINGLVAAVNWQHKQGWDINGNPGGDFFVPLDAQAVKDKNNTGTEDGSNIHVTFSPTPATVNQAFTEIGKFQAREYELKYNAGGTFTVYDHKSGQQLYTSTGSTFDLEGLHFDASSASSMNDGDRFLVKPHQAILEQFKTQITNPDEIATRGEDPNNPGNPAGVGDNVNIANLASLADKSLLYADGTGNPSETLLGGYSKMAVNVGMYVQGTQVQYNAQKSVLQQITQRSESLSGVNLDEEAANLMRFQQAYQASAKIIQTSQSMFATILGALRG